MCRQCKYRSEISLFAGVFVVEFYILNGLLYISKFYKHL